MQDEILLRQWASGHRQFSADVDRLVGNVGDRAKGLFRVLLAIGAPYARNGQRSVTGPAAATLLSGLAAIATTTILFATIAVLATPGSGENPSTRSQSVLAAAYELA